MSDCEKLVVRVPQEELRGRRPNLHAADTSLKAEQLPGAVAVEANVGTASSGSLSASIMAVIIICSLSMFVLLVVLGIYKYKR